MTDILTYDGYSARIGFDARDRIFFGRVAGIADGVGFHAHTVDDLVAAFEEAVDDDVETCAKVGKKPERPYSGKVMLRVSPELHALGPARATDRPKPQPDRRGGLEKGDGLNPRIVRAARQGRENAAACRMTSARAGHISTA